MNPEILEQLKKISLFEGLRKDDEALRQFGAIVRIKRAREGDAVISEGEVGSEMYIVFDGAVEIRKRTRAGDDYTVGRLDAAQNVFFGELALVDDDRRSATVVAIRDSSFLVIEKDDFRRLGDEHPEICLPVTRVIARLLARRLRKTTGDMLTIFDALVNELEP